MLVICNGAPKGGSTWVRRIVAGLRRFERIPERFQAKGWANASIDEALLDEFLRSDEIREGSYFSKQHWSGKDSHRALLGHEHVRVVNIIRDVRDVLVSRYFHDIRLKEIPEDTALTEYYFELDGREKTCAYIEYQLFWHGDPGADEPFLAMYERLHADFDAQVSELLGFLGVRPTAELIDRLRRETSFAASGETGEGKFHRKGIVGDWRNHLTEAMISDLDALVKDTGYDRLTDRIGHSAWVERGERLQNASSG